MVTAVSDVLAGVTISGLLLSVPFDLSPVFWLMLATAALYGGGVVMNDVFDARLDAVERPERPIPSGLIKPHEASLLGLGLLAAGIVAAGLASLISAFIAIAIAVAALIYNRWGKYNPVFGPLNMGLCRGLNLLLGASVLVSALETWWFLGLVPVIYIGAITMISRGEVHGGERRTGIVAGLLYLMAMASVAMVAVRNGQVLPAAVFIALWAIMVFIPLARAIQQPVGKHIGGAVKAGVLALILMNAAWAAAFGDVPLALIITALLPVSVLIARAFAVT